MDSIKIASKYDNLELDVSVFNVDNPKAIIQFVHGMSEHKERYYDYIHFLNENGYSCIIHDHRGHGKSVKKIEDLGNFYTEDFNAIVDDTYEISKYAKSICKDKPLYIFSHSMGTLVTRCYLKKYDSFVDKVILCGPPTKNYMVGLGLFIAKCRRKHIGPDLYLDKLLNSNFSKKFAKPDAWVCKNEDILNEYRADPYSGFAFQTNGFINLLKLQKESFKKGNYKRLNLDLPLLFIAGGDDPVVGNSKKFRHLLKFFMRLGYKNVQGKMYDGLRHEILNEKEHDIVYNDTLKFFNN